MHFRVVPCPRPSAKPTESPRAWAVTTADDRHIKNGHWTALAWVIEHDGAYFVGSVLGPYGIYINFDKAVAVARGFALRTRGPQPLDGGNHG